jgi:hypothetical protein
MKAAAGRYGLGIVFRINEGGRRVTRCFLLLQGGFTRSAVRSGEARLEVHFSIRKCCGSTIVIQGMKVTISSPRRSTSK